jgi:hypothetical protein
MPSTRKLPVRINEKKRTTFRGDHLIPQLSGTPESGFVSVKSGKTVALGSIVYVGRDVTPEMMLERFCEICPPPPDRASALRRLIVYVEALQSLKIGNVLSLSYSPDGLPVLRVEEEYFFGMPNTSLP